MVDTVLLSKIIFYPLKTSWSLPILLEHGLENFFWQGQRVNIFGFAGTVFVTTTQSAAVVQKQSFNKWESLYLN